jgi:hypothetical protein
MIGVSMLLTIALCAVVFTVIYTALDGFTRDFITQTDETPTVVAEAPQDPGNQPAATEPPAAATEPPAEQPAQQEQQAAAPTPTAEPEDTAADGEFNPDFEIASDVRINLREGPSTATSILVSLDPGTQLEYLDQEAPTDSPADGERWMFFATEDGLEGWVREIDVASIE